MPTFAALLLPLVLPLQLSAGVLALLGFGSIALFAVLAFISLNRHLRRSRQPWPGEDAATGAVSIRPEPSAAQKPGAKTSGAKTSGRE